MAIARPKKSKPSAWSFIRAPAPHKSNAHPIPPLGYFLIALVVIQWLHATSLAVKLQCLIGAALFSCTGKETGILLQPFPLPAMCYITLTVEFFFSTLEYTFYTMTVESPDGTVSIKPFAGRPGHTVTTKKDTSVSIK
jgi:hypothetical protein